MRDSNKTWVCHVALLLAMTTIFMFATVTNHERYRLINLLASYGIREPILSAFDAIPREMFVDKKYIYAAYEDRALPIGEGQSITQPSVIALTLASLSLRGDENILEVGIGSGYQTALLSKMSRKIYSIDRIKSLTNKASLRLKKLSINNVNFDTGDGTLGYLIGAPYDVILINASFCQVPAILISQLKDGGKLIMPVGDNQTQCLSLYIKKGDQFELVRKIMTVVFVPLIGKFGWPEPTT